ncbi:MAG: acyl-CoA thioesterase [Paracoccaceae bacterium]
MYPFVRMGIEAWRARSLPPLGLLDTHESRVTIWPWDLDAWAELNNGRTLTLFDLGRIPLGIRTGLDRTLREKRWGMTVAGSTVRYRRRVVLFDRLSMRTRCIGWDRRFIYMEQSLWRGEDCTGHLLLRSAIVGSGGIVDPAEAIGAMGQGGESPAFAPWVQAWIAAEAARPWPPER